jgi:hypothetical protein
VNSLGSRVKEKWIVNPGDTRHDPYLRSYCSSYAAIFELIKEEIKGGTPIAMIRGEVVKAGYAEMLSLIQRGKKLY